MTYLEATESEFTYNEVEKEVIRHGLSMDEFVLEVGVSDVYEGQTLVDW